MGVGKGTVTWFGICWHQQFEENAVVCCLPTSYGPSFRDTRPVFNTESVTPFATFTRSGTREFSLLFAPKRRSTRTSLLVGWGRPGGGAWLAGTPTRRLTLPRNYCLSGTLEEVCITCSGLHWRLTSLYCTYFCKKLLYTCFPVFIWMTLVL
jgi:hypothetical protein